jgi:hypothetical protein
VGSPVWRIWSSRPRWDVRTLLAVVLAFGVAFGWLRWQVDSYRKEWEVEQHALDEMRKSGATFTVGTRSIGPAWLRPLAGRERSKYFERVDGLFFTASDAGVAAKHKDLFKYLKMIIQD